MLKKIVGAVPLLVMLCLAPEIVLADAEELPVSGACEVFYEQTENGAGEIDSASPAETMEEGSSDGFLPYTEEDLYILAHLLAGECQNCPDEEQLYVGSVVLNRKNHPAFPGTIKEVVFQKGQYSCTRDGNYNREPTERNWANARILLESGSVLPGHVIWQSGGRQGKGVYLKTRWHYYCY